VDGSAFLYCASSAAKCLSGKFDSAKSAPFSRVVRILTKELLMTTHSRHSPPWYLWPFVAIVELTGRFVAMLIGFVLVVVGVIVSLTIVGAIVGVPLALVGFLLFLRGLF
jgi:hypothetical protein